MKVRDICVRAVTTVTAVASVVEAARIMRRDHVGSLVVTDADNGRPTGVLTDRDLVVEVLAQDVPSESLTVGDIMSGNPVVVGEQTDVLDALRILSEHGVRRAPVVDEAGKVAGIVSTDDLTTALSRALHDLARLFWRERDTEALYRSETGD